MPHHYTTFPQFTQRPDYFSICVHWSEALQHNNLFRCRINKPIMLWMAHSFSKRAQCVASAKNEHHIGCRPHFGERLWRQMSFHLSILLLNFNISCAGNTEWAHLPKKPFFHHRKWSGLFNHAIGLASHSDRGRVQSSQETRENSHFLFCRVPFRFRSGQSCKTSELWANTFYFGIIYNLLMYLFTLLFIYGFLMILRICSIFNFSFSD